ncbi:unnamed protein product [Trichogramma brassicae]|uniref:Reverse transcriptase/retrotransposon-derived protein RNase H-like domain-containing protein n=1 Tax=Trichogramma brassicae TaxID=86971 RepID=A0A6H5HYS0_9HYME|nr:unnamed protein product [Trichogramma brassicae]
MATIVDFPVQHRIVTSGRKPVFARPRASPAIDSHPRRPNSRSCSIGHHQAFIEPVGHPFAPRGRSLENTWRSRATTRLLNARTQPDRHPLPIIEDLLQESVGKVCSVVDLYKALLPESRSQKKDISKRRHDTFRPFRPLRVVGMLLGLRNSAQTFQRTMNYLLRGSGLRALLPGTTSSCSLLATNNTLQHLRELLTILKRARLFVNWEKCQIGRSKVVFAGYLIFRARIRATSSQSRKRSLDSRSPPTRHNSCDALNRHAEFFLPPMLCLALQSSCLPSRIFSEDCKKKRRSLHGALKQTRHSSASSLAIGFSGTISFLPSRPPLALHTDASNTAIGAALSQRHADDDWTAAGFSSLAEVYHNSAEVLTYDRELLGHLRGDQIFSEDTRGSKLHHHDRSSPSVLRPRAEVGQVFASTVTSARFHLALRCQDRLHARRREPSGRRSISHRRDYDANDAPTRPKSQRGQQKERTTKTHLRGKAKPSFTTS